MGMKGFGGGKGRVAGSVKPVAKSGLQKPPKQGKVAGITTPFSNRIMKGRG